MLTALALERALDQGRDPRPLPDARALWRQHRRHPRRLARLFRQGAAAADAGRGGAARRAAAGAGRRAGPTATPPRRDAARDRVLARAAEAGVYHRRGCAAARVGGDARRAATPFRCSPPHAAERAVAAAPGQAGRTASPSTPRFQARLESLAAERADALSDSVSVAILVADHQTGEILASVGSSGLFDERRDGFIDMTRAVRSPGSTLKPLIYGLAFELGLAHPETLIEDKPVDFAGYSPENFDREFHGTVSIRRALQLSLNVPAIELLEAVGPARLVARMRRAGATPVLPDISPPGLAVGLGGVGVTLTDLVAIHAAIARGGMAVPLVDRRRAPARSRSAREGARRARRLVRRLDPRRRAGPGPRLARHDRLQDRHLLRLSRRLGDRLRRPTRRSASGSAGRTARRCRA